jgi:hypothetical protein
MRDHMMGWAGLVAFLPPDPYARRFTQPPAPRAPVSEDLKAHRLLADCDPEKAAQRLRDAIEAERVKHEERARHEVAKKAMSAPYGKPAEAAQYRFAPECVPYPTAMCQLKAMLTGWPDVYLHEFASIFSIRELRLYGHPGASAKYDRAGVRFCVKGTGPEAFKQFPTSLPSLFV